MPTYGITGGAGFIGQHVTNELISRGHQVVVLDHSKRTESDSRTELFLADVRDKTAVFEFAAHVDGIIHLSAVLGTQETIGNPGPAIETNMLGGINVLEAARQYSLPLVYAGVGNYWMLNTYSSTKHAIERLLYQFRDEFNLPFATVRPVNAYGPGQRVAPPFGPGKVKKIMPAFVCRALTGSPLEVYGDGNQISDMVYVGDVARVFSETLEQLASGNVPRFPVEVGPLNSITVLGVAEEVIRQAKKFVNLESEIIRLPMRPGEKDKSDVPTEFLEGIVSQLPLNSDARIVKRKLRELGTTVSADTSTLEQIYIDPKTFIEFEQGCYKTVEWFHQNKGLTWQPL